MLDNDVLCISGIKLGICPDTKYEDCYPFEDLDIARSGFADMLNDDERNRAYDEAINYYVKKLVSNACKGKYFYCLDIGTGSGILSMMIARAFKKLNFDQFHVVAFEQFKPMACIARENIKENNFQDSITVVKENLKKRTCLSTKFDLIVAELLDTELIGEGCIDIYRHANKHFASTECIYIPQKATIYAEPVASSYLATRGCVPETIDLNEDKSVLLEITEKHATPRWSNIDDFQLSRMKLGVDFARICSKPLEVFEFDFSNCLSCNDGRSNVTPFKILTKVDAPVVLCFWWSILMLENENKSRGEDMNLNIVSCAPNWARDCDMLKRDRRIKDIYGREVWREHWMQGVYYLSKNENELLFKAKIGDEFFIKSHQLEYSFSFNITDDKFDTKGPKEESPAVPIFELMGFPKRSLFSTDYPSKLFKQLSIFIDSLTLEDELVVYNSSNSFLYSDILSHYKKVRSVIIEKQLSRVLYSTKILKTNNDLEKEGEECKFLDLRDADKKKVGFDCIIYDPIVGVNFWDILGNYRHTNWSGNVKSVNSKPVFPASVTVKCALVSFDNYNRIDMDCRVVEGFNLSYLDNVINEFTSKTSNNIIESSYLWEYGGTRLSEDIEVLTLDYESYQDCLRKGTGKIEKLIDVSFSSSDILISSKAIDACGDDEHMMKQRSLIEYGNDKSKLALAFWLDIQLLSGCKNIGCDNENNIICTGPVNDCDNNGLSQIGSEINWHRCWMQGSRFLHRDKKILLAQEKGLKKLKIEFNINDNSMKLYN